MTAVKNILIAFLFLLTSTASAGAELPKEQIYALYNNANEAFRQANSTKDPIQAERLYDKAILNFEKIIDQGRIENAMLYYNLANACFLRGQLGKAILNYRKAAKIDGSDENIQKNLAFARSKRIDKIDTKIEKRVLQTLVFWHYDFSLKTKFLLTFTFFGVVCLCATYGIWFGRSTVCTTTAVICGVLTLCFIVSVVVESKAEADNVYGVITAAEVVARQGDGQNYPPSFKEPLHEGTEFDLLEHRPRWLHIRLSDGSDGWITEGNAELI